MKVRTIYNSAGILLHIHFLKLQDSVNTTTVFNVITLITFVLILNNTVISAYGANSRLDALRKMQPLYNCFT